MRVLVMNPEKSFVQVLLPCFYLFIFVRLYDNYLFVSCLLPPGYLEGFASFRTLRRIRIPYFLSGDSV